MLEWHEQPYRGGGPAKVKGFPRALFPADAVEHGKTPSVRGPDVIAYKRTICRLGRWGVWDPASWDDGYWAEFAHGTPGPDIQNSGVAGVQYQQHIDATGWLGLATFNALCYALVPDDPAFPHAGEQAMDSVAVNLINQAWGMFAGHEPPPVSPQRTLRERALDRAKGELGYKESPAGSNDTKYGSWYGMNWQPWCAMFVSWAFELEGDSPTFVRGNRFAYVPYIVADAQARRNGLSITQDPIPGDLVCYDWNPQDTVFDHIGIFERWENFTVFQTIEGNTSTSSNSNGGEVMRRSRSTSSQKTIFVRVEEP